MRDFFPIERDACPFCGHWLDRVTAGPANPDAVPVPGDITLCIQCGGVLVFDDGMKVRPPTPEEQAEAEAMPDVVNMVEAIARVHGGTHGQDA
jgi:hypothetical protein